MPWASFTTLGVDVSVDQCQPEGLGVLVQALAAAGRSTPDSHSAPAGHRGHPCASEMWKVDRAGQLASLLEMGVWCWQPQSSNVEDFCKVGLKKIESSVNTTTIMGKTADLIVVQKTLTASLHKEGKPQTVIAEMAGGSQSAVSKHIHATPSGYSYIQKPRSCGCGGGLAVIHRTDILLKEIPVTTSSFECLHFTLSGATQLQVVLVYRPPKASCFLQEFSDLLALVCPMSPATLILGDFNIHVDSSSCSFAVDFLSLLDCFDIKQHLQGPTHAKGHTLDLVCCVGLSPSHLCCTDPAVSDHQAILFSVPVSLPKQPTKRFLDFFHQKVAIIHRQLQASTPSLPATLPLQDIRDFILQSGSTTHDPCEGRLPTIYPPVADIINASLGSGVVPSSFKLAAVTPTLKKTGLDPDDPNNYRPISNLPFLSKILERAVAAQLQHHMSHHELFEPLQSGFRPHHSTETALIKITNDLLIAADNGLVSILILLDLSAAFDTISHSILLSRLSELIGLTDTALSWFQSYLSNCKQYITLQGSYSTTATVNHGVPQGSVLGPLLFTIYLLPLDQIIRNHGLSFHCYADDTQLYVSTKPSSQLPPIQLNNCLHDIKTWMTNNLLKLNTKKTELMVVAPAPLLRKVGDLTLVIDGCPTSPSPKVRNLGVIMDSTLSFSFHIQSITKTAFFHLRNISRLRPSLTDSVTETLIHAFVTSRLVYCNGVLSGLPNKALDRLQYVQNSAARVLTHTKPWQHITPILKKLHWLPIKQRISYKILLLIYKSLHSLAPKYITDLLHPYTQSRSLRSTSKDFLSTPCTRLKTFGGRAFCAIAPTLWNTLPPPIRSATSLTQFQKHLKTHLFSLAYPPLTPTLPLVPYSHSCKATLGILKGAI
ncbi:hypothetical protein AALO_G00159280 [Alosa alosa]|uniref:Reverse transcriptase domain-containing protein n=1 Tax=Alosa alosa TaxID=278164 RepID=A0AAV6GH43_9TELE|nr:hypothetical protein AALO_G00159280 [Alosa alosa]